MIKTHDIFRNHELQAAILLNIMQKTGEMISAHPSLAAKRRGR